jgi:hypothetical protein
MPNTVQHLHLMNQPCACCQACCHACVPTPTQHTRPTKHRSHNKQTRPPQNTRTRQDKTKQTRASAGQPHCDSSCARGAVANWGRPVAIGHSAEGPKLLAVCCGKQHTQQQHLEGDGGMPCAVLGRRGTPPPAETTTFGPTTLHQTTRDRTHNRVQVVPRRLHKRQRPASQPQL